VMSSKTDSSQWGPAIRLLFGRGAQRLTASMKKNENICSLRHMLLEEWSMQVHNRRDFGSVPSITLKVICGRVGGGRRGEWLRFLKPTEIT